MSNKINPKPYYTRIRAATAGGDLTLKAAWTVASPLHDSPFQSAPTPDCIKDISIFHAV